MNKSIETRDGKMNEMSQPIRSINGLESKTKQLRLRFDVSEEKAKREQSELPTNPESLKSAMDSARESGENFVLADTYAKLALLNRKTRNDTENGPDIRKVSNPPDYEKLMS